MTLKTAVCAMAASSGLACMPRVSPATVAYQSRTPNASVAVYNAEMQRVAHLPNAFRIRFAKKINQVWNAWFYLPYDDVHASECTVRRFVEIYDGSTRVGLFRIIDRKTRHLATRKVYLYECEHVLATLNDDMLVDAHNAGVTGQTTAAINYVLGRQDIIRWKLGTCDWSRNFLYRWENKTLLEALFEIPRMFGEDYQWTFDTTSYPWTINLISPSTTVAAYVDYGRNLQEITREEDARDLYTRLYAYGQGVQGSVGQISVRDANPTGTDYVDADTLATYGIITRVWVDQRYTSSQTLYDAAVQKLALRKTPLYRYTVKVADIHRLTGEEIDYFTLGAYVQITDSELGIEVSTRVVELSKPDAQGKPGQVTIQLANKLKEFVDWTDVIYSPSLDDVVDGSSFSRVLSTSIEAGVIKLSAIPGGIIGSFPAPPEIAGLYLGASYLGYHDGVTWKTYMDIAGEWRCEGTDAYLRWDPTGTGSLSIKGIVDIQSGSSLPSLIVDTAQIANLAITAAKIDALAVTEAKIDNLAVTDAKIDTLSVSKLTSGILSGKYIQVAASGYIAQNKTSYSDTTAGFYLGAGGANALFNIGDASTFLKWTGGALFLQGQVDTRLETNRSYMRARDLYIDDSVIFNADGGYHNITGISELRGPVWTTSHYGWIVFPTSAADDFIIQQDPQDPPQDKISLNSSDGAEYGLRFHAPNGTIRFLVKDAGAVALAFENWQTTGGRYGDGYATISVGGVARTINFD